MKIVQDGALHKLMDNNGKAIYASQLLQEVETEKARLEAETPSDPGPKVVPIDRPRPESPQPAQVVQAEVQRRRFTVEYVDGYRKGDKPCPKEVFEGEGVGINSSINSSIAIPLITDQKVDKEGRPVSQTTQFLPHTFIKSLTVEAL